jgi:hypothetical protein
MIVVFIFVACVFFGMGLYRNGRISPFKIVIRYIRKTFGSYWDLLKKMRILVQRKENISSAAIVVNIKEKLPRSADGRRRMEFEGTKVGSNLLG